VTERLLVSIGPSPFSARLIRATKRLADRLNAEWIAAFVETPDYAGSRRRCASGCWPRCACRAAWSRNRNADRKPVSEAILRYARSRNVSKIVVGKHAGPLWKRLLRGSVLDELIQNSGEIESTRSPARWARPAHGAARNNLRLA